MLKPLRYLLEGGFVWLISGIFRLMPLDMASAIGGFLGRTFGPLLAVSKVADQNIARALPEYDVRARKQIIRDMWDNLGRVATEYPHMRGRKMTERTIVEGMEHLERFRDGDTPSFFVCAHIGNWEMGPKVPTDLGLELTLIYRKANNPLTEKMITKMRGDFNAELYPKGKNGAMKIVRAIKAGKAIGLMVDQKMNEGIAVPFFGRDAMTAPALAQLSLKYDVPVFMSRITRKDGAHFHMTIDPPFHFDKTGDDEKDVLAAMTKINGIVENWIRETPGQWFWVHRRWPKD